MKKTLEILQTLLSQMEQAFDDENWEVLTTLDAEFYAQLMREPFSALSSHEQGFYRAAYALLFSSHQALLTKCSTVHTLNIENLHLLRQQKNAGLAYQTVQSNS